MQISVSARHGDLSQATQENISQKVGKLQKFHDRITAIEITVDLKQPERTNVEIRVSAEETKDFIATDSNGSLQSAVDSVVQKLEQQLKKHKEKITSHRNAALKHAEVPQDED